MGHFSQVPKFRTSAILSSTTMFGLWIPRSDKLMKVGPALPPLQVAPETASFFAGPPAVPDPMPISGRSLVGHALVWSLFVSRSPLDCLQPLQIGVEMGTSLRFHCPGIVRPDPLCFRDGVRDIATS